MSWSLRAQLTESLRRDPPPTGLSSTVDLNHGSLFVPGRVTAPTVSVGEMINERIDAALIKSNAEQAPRDYLGGSILGHPCARKLHYDYLRVPQDPWKGQTLRIFAAGHVFETLVLEWLRRAGFDVRDRDPKTGHQYERVAAGGKIKHHIDGVVLDGPHLGFDYPALWENKTLNQKSWTDLVKHGLAKSKETYHGQAQLYMGYFDLKICLFTALNKNTCELYHEMVRFDLAVAQRLSDRAVDIIQSADAGVRPPRISASPEYYVCRSFCGHRERCWSDNP